MFMQRKPCPRLCPVPFIHSFTFRNTGGHFKIIYQFISFPKTVQIKLLKIYRDIVLILKCMYVVPIETSCLTIIDLSTSETLIKLTFFHFTSISKHIKPLDFRYCKIYSMLLLLIAKYKVISSQEYIFIIASAVRFSDVSELFISSPPFL